MKDSTNKEQPQSNALNAIVRHAWRLIIAIVGGTVLLLGVIMVVTPGPAMVVIPLGLAILAIEFVWAQRLIRRIRVTAKWKMRKQRERRDQGELRAPETRGGSSV